MVNQQSELIEGRASERARGRSTANNCNVILRHYRNARTTRNSIRKIVYLTYTHGNDLMRRTRTENTRTRDEERANEQESK